MLVHGFNETKMIGLLICIIVILLIILIVVAVRNSETSVEPFSALSDDNYANGVYMNKLIIGGFSNDVKINEVGLIDFFLPDGIIVMVKNKEALPEGIQWTQLDGGYYLSDHIQCRYFMSIDGKNTNKTFKEEPGKKYTETTLGKQYTLGQIFEVKRDGFGSGVRGTIKCYMQQFNSDGVIERPEPSSLEVMCFKKEQTTDVCNSIHPKDMIMLSVNTSWNGKTQYECKKCLLKTSKDASLKFNEAKDESWSLPPLFKGDTVHFKQVNNFDNYAIVKLDYDQDAITGVYYNRTDHMINGNSSKFTTYPISQTVNIFVNNGSNSSSSVTTDQLDPINNNYTNGILANGIMLQRIALDSKALIDTVYPVGTVLLFMREIDLAKYWPGTKWKEMNYGYLGHDPDTKIGELFGANHVYMEGNISGYKITITKRRLWTLNYLKEKLPNMHLKYINTFVVSNHLPRISVKIYQRTE